MRNEVISGVIGVIIGAGASRLIESGPSATGILGARLDPIQRAALDYLKKYSTDPSVFSVVDLWKPKPFPKIDPIQGYDHGVYVVYRTRNPMGGLVVVSCVVCTKVGVVVHVRNHPQPWEVSRLYGDEVPKNPLADQMGDPMGRPLMPK